VFSFNLGHYVLISVTKSRSARDKKYKSSDDDDDDDVDGKDKRGFV